MGTRTPERAPRYRFASNANDAFKARWSTRLHWATIVAVGLHALLFLWSPSWEQALPPPGGAYGGAGIELLYLDDSPQSADGLLAALVVTEEPSPTPPDEPETDPGEGAGAPEHELASLSEGLREQLRRQTSPLPSIVESEPEPEPAEPSEDGAAAEESEAAEGDGMEIGGGYSLSEFEALTDDELLALQRLSAVRPELAFVSPSSWILLRNPSEVGNFLEDRFGASPGSAGAPASLSVAIWVDDRGSVEWAEIKDSSGDQRLDESALELFREVVSFRPARQGGVRVPMAVIFWIPYRW